MSTRSAGRISAASMSVRAVVPETGKPAACANETLAGLRAMQFMSTTRYSAKAPAPFRCCPTGMDPNTGVPGGKHRCSLSGLGVTGTPLPAEMISPEKSVSAMQGVFRKMDGARFIIMVVPGCRDTWVMRMRTSVLVLKVGMGRC